MLLNKSVGVFWVYQNIVYLKTQKLDTIKSINGFKDSDLSHYQVWDEIKLQNNNFYIYEYEDIPRGRVVYDCNDKIFIVYCNPIFIDNINIKDSIIKAFDLPKNSYKFIEDEHYTIKHIG
jgi:hypothetical protein